MKAEELRIGNIIAQDTISGTGAPFEIILRVTAVEIRDASHYCDDWTGKPIPLTSEWLEKFGFEPEYEVSCDNMEIAGGIAFQNSGERIEQIIAKEGHFFFVRDQSASEFDGSTEYTYKEIHHVHQLQNLYFALTGTELTLND